MEKRWSNEVIITNTINFGGILESTLGSVVKRLRRIAVFLVHKGRFEAVLL